MTDMADNDTKVPGDTPAPEAAAASNDNRNASPWWENPDAPPPPDLTAEIERLESEKADLTDRLIRLAAEMDNLRKRTERELTDTRKYAVAKFAGDMLVVGDNLRRALAAVPAERLESGDEVLKALSDGVQVTEREMERLLERNGVTRIAAKGERFDPHRHQAMFEVPDPSGPRWHRRRGGPGRVPDRRPRAPRRAGRCLQGRAQGGQPGSCKARRPSIPADTG